MPLQARPGCWCARVCCILFLLRATLAAWLALACPWTLMLLLSLLAVSHPFLFRRLSGALGNVSVRRVWLVWRVWKQQLIGIHGHYYRHLSQLWSTPPSPSAPLGPGREEGPVHARLADTLTQSLLTRLPALPACLTGLVGGTLSLILHTTPQSGGLSLLPFPQAPMSLPRF